MRARFWFFLSIIFRYFPIRYRTGLIKIGDPNPESPVFVSGNYYQTVYKLLNILKGHNCYVLICDSAGINVWCAAGAGDFNENKISDAISTYKLSEVVNHNNIILPQLGAVGIDLNNLKRGSGFIGKWGPASYYDLPAFIANNLKQTKEHQKLRISFRDNIELSLGIFIAYIMSYLPYYITYAYFFGTHYNTQAINITGLVFINLFLTAFLDYLPFKWPSYNVALMSIPIFAFLGIIYKTGQISTNLFILYMISNLIITVLVCVDMQGSTIHFKASFLSWFKRFDTRSQFWPTLNREKCVTCRKCLHICPKDMISLEDNYPKFDLDKECCECLACVKQCAYDAIINLNKGSYKKDVKSISEETLKKIM